MKHLFIPDVQAKSDVDLEHLSWLGKYIVDKKPEVIVCIGDFADMPSLSSYDKGKKCVDKDTEFLTREGWKKISEFKNGDYIAAYDANTNSIRFEQPVDYVVIDCDEFYQITTSRVDMCVSSDHRLIFKNLKGVTTEQRAEDFVREHDKLEGGHTGRFITTFNYNTTGLQIPETILRLLIAFKADGSQCGNVNRRNLTSKFVHKFHFKRPEKISRIRKLLIDSGLSYKECISSQEGFVDFYTHIHNATKQYDFDYDKVSMDDARIIIDEMLNWDGCRSKNNFSSIHKQDADFIQYCFALTGQRASVRLEDNSGGYNKHGLIYRIHGTGQNLAGVKRQGGKQEIITVDSIDKKAYCFTTSTGAWLQRRQGHISVTGNCFEGRRYKKDIKAAKDAMDLLLEPMRAFNKHAFDMHRARYKPRLVMTLGNHEERIARVAELQPELEGVISYDDLPYEDWEVHDYLKPVVIDGVTYVHYLANPMTGKPYTGTALSQLTKVGTSFVVGHKQTLDVATRFTLNGHQQWGIIAGAFYSHHESYKGYQGNDHWRGAIMLHRVINGSFDPCFISLDYLRDKYENK